METKRCLDRRPVALINRELGVAAENDSSRPKEPATTSIRINPRNLIDVNDVVVDLKPVWHVGNLQADFLKAVELKATLAQNRAEGVG